MPTAQSYWDEDLAIFSAENVNFTIETAGLGSRFAASVIDCLLQLLVYALFGYIGGLIADSVPLEWIPSKFVMNVIMAMIYVIAFFIFFGYYYLFEWLWDGQTPGKRALGLRVIQPSGLPITSWQALVRNVLRFADIMPPYYGLGGLVAILNAHNQRIGDLVAGTVVARERRDAKQRKVLDINTAVSSFLKTIEGGDAATSRTGAPLPDSMDLSGTEPAAPVDAEAVAITAHLDLEDYELTRDFINRRQQLPTAARERLAESLAIRLALKLGRPVPLKYEIEPFLEALLSSFQRSGKF